jgi:hypothetical protein
MSNETIPVRIYTRRASMSKKCPPIDWSKVKLPSPEEIIAASTWLGENGRASWKAKTLAGWGIAWPPPKGWRKELEKRYADSISIQ